MKPFEFENRLTIKVTPNQIHKIMDKIREKIDELKYADSTKESSFTQFSIKKMDVNVDTSRLIEKFENQFTQRYKDKKFLLELKEDLLYIKEELFKFNVTYGVSQKLSQIEMLKQRVKYYQEFKECLDCENDIDETIERAKEFLKNSDSEIESVDIEILFYEYENVKKLSIEANKKILELEKEITLLNASHEIEIKINKNTAELVGLG
jgi:hypothetical protein